MLNARFTPGGFGPDSVRLLNVKFVATSGSCLRMRQIMETIHRILL